MITRRQVVAGGAAFLVASFLPATAAAYQQGIVPQFEKSPHDLGVRSLYLPDRKLLVAHSIDAEIYMFHHEAGSALDWVIRQALAAGRQFVTVNQLADLALGEEPTSGRYAVITFDDGYLIQKQAVPVLDRHSVRATFYVMAPSWQGDGVNSYFPNDFKVFLSEEGHEIGCHTANHPPNLIALRQVNFGAYLQEVFGAKLQLEDLIQAPVTAFAYPNGVFNQAIVADVAMVYKAAVTTIPGRLHSAPNVYTMPRVRVN